MGSGSGVRADFHAAVVDGCRLRGQGMGRAAGGAGRRNRRSYALFITQARVVSVYRHAPADPDRRYMGDAGDHG